MTTRAKFGIRKPKQMLSLLTTTKSPLPKSYKQALSDPNWTPAMTDEHGAMIETRTWDLVPRPPGVNIVNSMWLFKHKYDADGALTRHKARSVANGKSQEAGIDFTKTFSPVVKPATIRTGHLEEIVYMHQAPGFVDPRFPNHIITKLKEEFPMTDMGKLQHFLGIKAEYNAQGMFLSQASYAKEILDRAGDNTVF
ncbi:uncharacterized protein LOC112089835 [Eutrema salsugineum]|uniref:uncharacterized protein LOC112089835 n=1 Tax=Eutrema salsugineum TaxID=72664 RepID=UPI000CED776F|nr:uncharacterized protein LOC112089835 [Eutrema salsugineum]